MAEAEIDALLVTEGSNYMYFSGHRVPYARTSDSGHSRPSAVVLPREGEPIVIVHAFHQLDAVRAGGARDVRAYEEFSHGATLLVRDALRERCAGRGRVGTELGYEQRLGLPYAEFIWLQKDLGSLEFVDAAHLLWRLRMVKSEAEVACIREACRITGRAYAAMFARLREGMTERDVSALLAIAMMEEGADRPGLLMVTSDPARYRTGDAATRRTIRRGDMVWSDAGAIFNAYWADFSRAAVVGGPSRDQAAMQRAIHELTMRGVEMTRPGRPIAEIARVCNAGMEELGLPTNLAGRIGHGLGLQINELPHVATYDPTVLESGMVITIEPGVVTPYGLFHVEENVLVTADGYELLSTAPRELAALS